MKLHMASGSQSAQFNEPSDYPQRTSISSVDQEADTLVNEISEKQRAIPHAVSLSRELLVDPRVARLEGQRRVDTQFLLDIGIVHPCFHPLKSLITEGSILLTIAGPTNIIQVEAKLCLQVSTGKVGKTKFIRTLERAKELRPTVELSRHAGPARVKVVATLNEPLAGRDLGSESLTLGTLWVVVHSVGAVTSPIRDGSHLFVRVRDSVGENDRSKIDLDQTGNGGQGKFLVLPVEDGGGVRSVCSAVTFRSHMEGCLGVFRETGEEQLEESVYILPSGGAAVDLGAIIRVGISDVDRLVEEEDIAMRVPRVLVVRYGSLIGNLARTELEE